MKTYCTDKKTVGLKKKKTFSINSHVSNTYLLTFIKYLNNKRKLKHREAKKFAWVHTTTKWQSGIWTQEAESQRASLQVFPCAVLKLTLFLNLGMGYVVCILHSPSLPLENFGGFLSMLHILFSSNLTVFFPTKLFLSSNLWYISSYLLYFLFSTRIQVLWKEALKKMFTMEILKLIQKIV